MFVQVRSVTGACDCPVTFWVTLGAGNALPARLAVAENPVHVGLPHALVLPPMRIVMTGMPSRRIAASWVLSRCP